MATTPSIDVDATRPTNGALPAVRLVLGVARLGELDLEGWWRSHGLSTTGDYVLAQIVPHTAALAALELDVLSAARRHEQVLVRRSALHLFSDELPFKRLALSWLAERKLDREPDPLVASLASWTTDNARGTLAVWAGAEPGGEALGEGLRVGTLTKEEVNRSEPRCDIARTLAAGYLASSDRQLRLPYYDLIP